MDRQSAEKALGIIREVIQNTRDDLIAHNWGLIWMIHAFTNFAGTAAGTIVDRFQLPVFWYLAPLSIVSVVDIIIVLVLMKRDRGVRSFVEWQLWGIWITFIIFTIGGAGVIALTGVPPRLFGALFAMTSGIGFAMMGVVFYSRFLIFAVLLLVVMILAAIFPDLQWYLIGLVWWGAMFIPGVSMYREQQRRLQHGRDSTIL